MPLLHIIAKLTKTAHWYSCSEQTEHIWIHDMNQTIIMNALVIKVDVVSWSVFPPKTEAIHMNIEVEYEEHELSFNF